MGLGKLISVNEDVSGHAVTAVAVVVDFCKILRFLPYEHLKEEISKMSWWPERGKEYLTVLQSFIVERFLEYNKC